MASDRQSSPLSHARWESPGAGEHCRGTPRCSAQEPPSAPSPSRLLSWLRAEMWVESERSTQQESAFQATEPALQPQRPQRSSSGNATHRLASTWQADASSSLARSPWPWELWSLNFLGGLKEGKETGERFLTRGQEMQERQSPRWPQPSRSLPSLESPGLYPLALANQLSDFENGHYLSLAKLLGTSSRAQACSSTSG